MTGWLRSWGLSVFMWASCGMALGSLLAGAHLSRWITAAWIIYTAWWVGIARMKDSTIRIQADTIRILRSHRDSLRQQQKAMWS